jgi:hypothetical protein
VSDGETESESVRVNRFATISRASAGVSPPTSVPPTVTPAAISRGPDGFGVVVVVSVVVVSVGVVSVGVVSVVVVPPSAPAVGVERSAAAKTPANAQQTRAQSETARFTTEV